MTRKFLTKEPQYQELFDQKDQRGLARLGVMNSQVWHDDPRRLVFTLSRYKFVAKLFSGKNTVLEVGCGDAFASRIVQQEVGSLTAIDFDPLFIQDIQGRVDAAWPMQFAVHDMLSGPFIGKFDAVYSLDVLEHIDHKKEDQFLQNTLHSLKPEGVAIFGMPSLESQNYASPQSKDGHINCKTGNDFKILMQKYFHNVFIFAMNDEVVHTGYLPMAHYLLAVCSNLKS